LVIHLPCAIIQGMSIFISKRIPGLAAALALPLLAACGDGSSGAGSDADADADADADTDSADPDDTDDPDPPGKILQIDAGWDHVCAIGSFGLKCWGRQGGFPVEDSVPQDVTDPVSLSTGVYSNCVVDASGARCWGLDTDGVNVVPELSNPCMVSTSHSHACAIDDNGVTCWGVNTFGQIDVPPELDQPIIVSAGETHTCVVEADGTVVCWGTYEGIDLTDLPTLSDPRKVHEGYCALDGMQLVCWEGVDYSDGDFEGVDEIRDFQLGNGYACVTGNESGSSQAGPVETRVACSGGNDSGAVDFPADLVQPTQIACGNSFACAVEDGDRLRCWGSSAGGEAGDVPLEFEPESGP
jgi:alpha-tubulin suppressor-like RCC1 family protein